MKTHQHNIIKEIAQELDCGNDCYFNLKTKKIIAIPNLSQVFDEEEFKEAFARAEYYKLRYNLEQDNLDEVKQSALKIYKISFNYFIVTALLFISGNLLKFIFKKYYKR